MNQRRQFEKALCGEAIVASYARPEWYKRAWWTRFSRRCERVLMIIGGPLLLLPMCFYAFVPARMLLGGFRIGPRADLLNVPNGPLLPLVLLAGSMLGIVGAIGSRWRHMLASSRMLAVLASLPVDDRKLYSRQRLHLIALISAPLVVCGIVMFVLAYTRQFSLAQWLLTAVLLFAEGYLLVQSILLFSWLIERRRRNRAIFFFSMLVALTPVLVSIRGPEQANHVGGIARFLFFIVPSGWPLGVFYHGVIKPNVLAWLMMVPAIALLSKTGSWLRRHWQVTAFSFEPPNKLSVDLFPPEEREAEEQRQHELARELSAQTRNVPPGTDWTPEELHEALFPPLRSRSARAVDRVLLARMSSRSLALLEAFAGQLPQTPRVATLLVVLIVGVVLIRLQSFIAAQSMVLWLYLTLFAAGSCLPRNRLSERKQTWLMNFQRIQFLPVSWAETMRGLRLILAMIGLPLIVVTLPLALLSEKFTGLPPSYTLPRYFAWPCVLTFAAPLWVAIRLMATRWQIVIVGPAVLAVGVASVVAFREPTEALHPTLGQFAIAVLVPLAGVTLLDLLLRRLYHRGWLDFN